VEISKFGTVARLRGTCYATTWPSASAWLTISTCFTACTYQACQGNWNCEGYFGLRAEIVNATERSQTCASGTLPHPVKCSSGWKIFNGYIGKVSFNRGFSRPLMTWRRSHEHFHCNDRSSTSWRELRKGTKDKATRRGTFRHPLLQLREPR
jgi:hypothetical protein